MSNRSRHHYSAVLACALAFGCGLRAGDPSGPEAAGPARATPGPVRGTHAAGPGGRDVLIGELCPEGAGGRPAVLPQLVRGRGWSAGSADLAAPIERRSARQFVALGWSGRRVGVFSVAGAARSEGRAIAIGSYAGGSPCETRRRPGASPALDAACLAAQNHCAVAVAMLEPAGGFAARPVEEDPDPVDIPAGGACVSGELLLADIDGDGVDEAYPATSFIDERGAPADEVTRVVAGGGSCEPVFAQRGVVPAGGPRSFRGMDILAVADFDSDGRREILALLHYDGRRTWALYSAVESVGRLDLVGETTPWPAR
jgi:hypothetical protein